MQKNLNTINAKKKLFFKYPISIICPFQMRNNVSIF